eukprot:TRINITY_DN702_c0_g1_i1.p1 TRINITY_DN702_c0_g1~~TRINITY_DN702_c0_g1_i1.p1  ORF type:complete len:461 (+),score=93.18 TRINITY_DN702_c0_g1_i1:37-1419(+)
MIRGAAAAVVLACALGAGLHFAPPTAVPSQVHISVPLPTPQQCVGFAVVIIAAGVLRILLQPLKYTKSIGGLGTNDHTTFLLNPGAPREYRRFAAKKPGSDLFPPYPNGWFRIALSHHLPRGGVSYVKALGLNLAVWRGLDGKVTVMDAYCPHLGANLAVGGKVVEHDGKSCLECPFHGWAFNNEGKCAHIGYAREGTKIPASAATKLYHSLEINKMILLWYDAEDRAPQWFPPRVAEIETGWFKYHGETDHRARAHIAELPENGADVPHLAYLHGALGGLDITEGIKDFAYHDWEATWEPDETPAEKEPAIQPWESCSGPHLAIINITQKMVVKGWTVPGTTANVRIRQIGPGMVCLDFRFPFGRLMIFELVTPLQPMMQQVQHVVYGGPWVPRIFAKILLLGLVAQWEKDAVIFNNKQYLRKPTLVAGDGPILRYRRWFSQFYSESSANVPVTTDLEW